MHRSIATKLGLAAALALAFASDAGAQSAQAKTNVGGKPSGLVALGGNAAPGQNNPLFVQSPDGTAGPEFELPPGTALVVTDLVASLNGAGSAGLTRGGLTTPTPQTIFPYFSFYGATQGGDSEHFTTGVLWTTTPTVLNFADSADAVFVHVTGYLVKSK